MAMCQGCKDAATTGDMSLHCGEPGKPGRDCETCQHYPANDSRVIRAQKQLDGRGTPSVTADLSDSPVNSDDHQEGHRGSRDRRSRDPAV
jgi:hypothetical protein